MHRGIIFLLIFAIVFRSCCSIVCTPDICANVDCKKVEKCDKPNQVIKPGGFCRCCYLCHTILGENETCSDLQGTIRGVPTTLEECGKGFICYNGKCTSFKTIGTI